MAAYHYRQLGLKFAAVYYVLCDISQSVGIMTRQDCEFVCRLQSICKASAISEIRACLLQRRWSTETDDCSCHVNALLHWYTTQSSYNCPPGFDKQGSSCYFFSTYSATYWDATKICSKLGGHLAVITSKEKDDILKNLARTQGKADHYRIGATDVRQEGTWLWENPFRSMDYTNWEYAQPDNYLGDEDCLELKITFSSYNWNDIPCNSSSKFICEIKL